MDFDCEYNAPMYFDFAKEGSEKDGRDEEDDRHVETYFDVDHENQNEFENEFETRPFATADAPAVNNHGEPSTKVYKNLRTSWKHKNGESKPAKAGKTPLEEAKKSGHGEKSLRKALANTNDAEHDDQTEVPNEEEAYSSSAANTPTADNREEPLKKVYMNLRTSWKHKKGGSNPAIARKMLLEEAKKSSRRDTPERRSLRKAVAKTIENVANSPNLILTKKTPKRLNSSSGQPRLVIISKAGSSSRRSSTGVPSAASVAKGKSAVGGKFRTILRKAEGGEDRKAVFNRLSKPSGPMKAAASATVDFSKMLRNYQNKDIPNAKPKSLVTNLAERTRRERNRSADPALRIKTSSRFGSVDRLRSKNAPAKYVSMAEAISNMGRGTPDRFRTLPRRCPSSSPKKVSLRSRSISPRAAAKRATIPRSPHLSTIARNRPNHVLSSQEIMEKEIEEMKKYQFKARAIGEGVKPLKAPETDYHHRPTTIPQPFHFAETRHYARPASPVKETFENFKARPAPKNILDHPVGVPEKKSVPPVVPTSPSFATKDRLAKSKEALNRHHTSTESVDSTDSSSCSSVSSHRVIKSRPAPHFGVPNLLPPKPKKTTTMQPFSFDDKISSAEMKKKEKIREILEQERKEREFKANPLPKLDRPANLPLKEVTLPTKSEPFDFAIEKRVEDRLKKWEEEVEHDLQKQKEAANFKARPVKLPPAPFIPAPSNKPLIEISNFELHSDRRAQEREQFELKKKEREAELGEQKRMREDQRKKEELEEVRNLRQKAVPRSHPVRNYQPLKILPSDKPLTKANSPDFTKKKVKAKAVDTPKK